MLEKLLDMTLSNSENKTNIHIFNVIYRKFGTEITPTDIQKKNIDTNVSTNYLNNT